MRDKKKQLIETAKKNKAVDANVDVDTKNKAGFLIIGITLLMLVCLGIYFKAQEKNVPTMDNKTSAVQFKDEYEELNGKQNENSQKEYLELSIPKKNPIEYATYETILSMLENGTGVIYFGFPECPWCRNLIPSMLNAANDAGIDKIYYLNALADRDTLELDEKGKVITKQEGTENYQKLLKKLDSVLPDYILKDSKGKDVKTDRKRLYFPAIVVVKDGKIVGFHAGTLESQKDPYQKLTETEEKELTEKLIEHMQKLKVCNGAC